VRRLALALLGSLLVVALADAIQLTLTPLEINDALYVGQSRLAADRTRFHTPYRIPVSQGPVDYVDVITPFRRVVLAAEGRALIGDRSFGQRQALELLSNAAQQVDLNIELTFHPQNVMIGIPDFVVTLTGANATVLPTTRHRIPRFGARVEGLPPPLPIPTGPVLPGGSEPMLGGTVIAVFDGNDLDATGTMDLEVAEDGRALARARIEFGKLR